MAERATWAVAEPPAEGRGRLRGVWRRYRIPQSPAESLQSLSPRGRAKRQTSLVDNWTISHFSKANPEGPGQSDVAALLRSIASSLDELGDVEVQDIVFHSELEDGEDRPTMTVYYHASRRRPEL